MALATGHPSPDDLSIQDIHDLAAAELASPTPGFRPGQYIRRMKSVRTGPRGTVELEARIMLHFAGRINANKTRIFMNSLRQERAEEGNSAAFDAFEAMLCERLGTDVLIGHDYSPNAFKNADHEAVWRDVRATFCLLQEMCAGVFLNSGTLLGAVRDGRLIDHDDDVDLGVVIEAGDETDAARVWMALCEKLKARDLLESDEDRPMVQAKLKTDGGMAVDLFPAWVRGGKAFVFPHTYGDLDAEDLLPLKDCPATGLRVPAEPEKMLAVNYGADWRVPNPYFTFPWAQGKKRFKRLLNAMSLEVAQ